MNGDGYRLPLWADLWLKSTGLVNKSVATGARAAFVK